MFTLRRILHSLPVLGLGLLLCAGVALAGGVPDSATVAGQPLPLQEGFDDCRLTDWSIISVDEDTENTWTCFAEFSNISANGFGNDAPADEWLITPALNLDAQENDALSFRTQTRYTDAGLAYPQLRVLYSQDFDPLADSEDPAAATWTELTEVTLSAEDSDTYTESGIVDLSAIEGENVYIAFHYRSSGTESGTAARWRLDDVYVREYLPLEMGACGDPATLISAIQDSGTASPETGNEHVIEGVVVGDFQSVSSNRGLRGFFVQEQDADQDGDDATSEGIFVFDAGDELAVDVSLGETVRIAGTVAEFDDRTTGDATLTQLVAPVVISCASPGEEPLPTAGVLTLPETVDGELERFEGMRVRVDGPLTISQNFFIGRYGQLTLSAGDRLYQPTNLVLPDSAEIDTIIDRNARSLLILDDGLASSRCGDNPDPVPYLGGPPPAVIRAGDTISDVIGVLDYGQINAGSTGSCASQATRFAGDYRLHPTTPPTFISTNTRTEAPEEVGGDIRVASFNVLNYFNGEPRGAFPTSRGADTPEELTRQTAKLTAAILALDADVLGLMELENDYADGPDSAAADLVAALNAAADAELYAFVDPGANVGTDEISVGFLYKPGVITPVGPPAILDDPSFTDPNKSGQDKNRPALAQTFTVSAEENPSAGESFTAVVNHFKSKGSDCGGAPDDDPLQGNCNGTRTAAAAALSEWLATDPTASEDPDLLILGDLNAYAKEDPVTTLEAAGFFNLVAYHGGATAYSYIFDGKSGYLDHALAGLSLMPHVSGVTEWHINTDEPPVIDYDEDFNPPGYFSPDPFRASDHDPVLVGLTLAESALEPSIYLPIIVAE